MAALPEVFATWRVARSGQVTPAVTSVTGDHTVTPGLSFVPLATLLVGNLLLFATTVAGAVLVGALYAAFAWWGGEATGFQRWQVAALAAVALLWALVVVLWCL